jgi:Flp pilus assembly pilin Flp
MRRLLQATSDAAPWARGGARPATQFIEYGMLAVLVTSIVSAGATLAGKELNTVFYSVADALGGAAHTPAVTVGPGIKAVAQTPALLTAGGQRASHKGGPVKREVSGGTLLPF